MEEKRMVVIGVGVVLVVSTITILAVTLSAKHDEGTTPELRENKTTPLLLISLDGYRSDYFFRYQPTLKSMADNGVKALYMMPSYPTITFPNHYTIVTGLYPASHGIVSNEFYDPNLNEIFTLGSKDGKWWGGEPIWHTLTGQNKTSAAFFWPGSDVNITGQYPTEYRPFDKDVPFEDRVDQVVEWLSRPDDTRPDWVCLYFQEPDEVGHAYGPDSREVDDMLTRVDGMINRLLSGLRRNNMEDKVNIILLADHGMAQAGLEKRINLDDYIDVNSSTKYVTYGAFSMMHLKENVPIEGMLNKLACPAGAPFIRAFPTKELPKRFHYYDNARIGDIVLDLDSGYYTSTDDWLPNGEHGYDNHNIYMEALFIATGPDFKKGETLEPFQNIEIYNLMCYLTGVEPAPNNGTEGALYGALVDPPEIPELPVDDVLVSEFPPVLSHDLLTMAQCRTNNLTEEEKAQLQAINITQNNQNALAEKHLPWGIPLSGNQSADVTLLYQQDHVTGFSEKLKMPVWTSFTVSDLPQGTPKNDSLWLSDVRLDPSYTPTCDSYASGLLMFPLFPPELSMDASLSLIPYMVSNSVPLEATREIMDYLDDFLQQIQTKAQFSFNVKMGPVFDNYTNSTDLQVPSDLFLVITFCRELGVSIHNCENASLDAVSFIIPETLTVDNNCKMDPNYGSTMFLSTVHDIEVATGLTFYPDLEPSTRLQLALRIHRNVKEIFTQNV